AALGVHLRLALGAGGAVRQYALTRVMTELSVHQGGESVSQMLLCAVSLGRLPQSSAHALAPPPPSAGTRGTREPRSARAFGERWASALRSCERPRWMRERTVPSLTPRVAAISS